MELVSLPCQRRRVSWMACSQSQCQSAFKIADRRVPPAGETHPALVGSQAAAALQAKAEFSSESRCTVRNKACN
jgi:hypothetical protein